MIDEDILVERLIDTVVQQPMTAADWDLVEDAAKALERVAYRNRLSALRAERDLCQVCGDDLKCGWMYPERMGLMGRLPHPQAGLPMPHIHGWCAMCRESRRQGVM